jgi:hypothetical protein
MLIDEHFFVGCLFRRPIVQIRPHDGRKAEGCQLLRCFREIVDRPPAKAIQHLRFDGIAHDGIEAVHMNDSVLLALGDPSWSPVERVMPPPHERAACEVGEPEFFTQFAPQSFFDRLPFLHSAAGRDPEAR